MNVKSLQKKLLILTPFLIGIGILLVLIGFVLGGAPGFRIGPSGIVTQKDKASYVQEKTRFDPVDSMELQVSFGDIIFEESDDFYIEYRLTNSSSRPVYYIENGTLIFNAESKNTIPFINFDLPTINNDYLKIYMPSNTKLNHLSMDSASGNIVLSNAEIVDIDASVDFGNVDFTEIISENINLKLSSGKADLYQIETENLFINNDFGDITIDHINMNLPLDKTSTITLQMSSGSLTMKNLYADSLIVSNDFGSCEGQNMNISELTMKLSSGTCNLDQLSTNYASITNDFGSTKLQLTEKEDAYDFILTTDFGKISINESKQGSSVIKERGDRNKIEIANSSGDIEIKTLK